MRIALIDTGIDKDHKRLKTCSISGISLNEKNGSIQAKTGYYDVVGHGTGVAAIIHKQVPDAKLVAVKIFHTDLTCQEKMVSEAIKWCVNNHINIINLSLGVPTPNPSYELKEACKLAFRKNIPLIAAAYKKMDEACYPAFFEEVFGVTSGAIKNKNEFGIIKQSPIEFIAKGDMHRVASKNGGFVFADGSSYACAYFTGIVATILTTKSMDIPTLKKVLFKRANKNIKPLQDFAARDNKLPKVIKHNALQDISQHIDASVKFNWMQKIALFPVSEKEMKTLITLKNYCKYEITKFFDYPRVIGAKQNDISIQDWMPDNADLDSFDTLVVGYFFEHYFAGNVKYGFEIIEKAIEYNKNLFVFDFKLKQKIQNELLTPSYKGKIYCPVVNHELLKNIQNIPYNSKLETPVLAVIGTGSKQGKFTVQLIIKKILEEQGYHVSQISTEPHGELFGSVFSFPMGYNPTIYIPQDKWPFFLKSLEKSIELYFHPDLMLTGIQGWTIQPYPSSRLSGTELRSLQFLLGTQPDAVICSIGPNDDIELIQKNIQAMQMVTNANILFFTIVPFALEVNNINVSANYNIKTLTEPELQQRINYYQEELKKQVINVMNSKNTDFILNTIQKFFS